MTAVFVQTGLTSPVNISTLFIFLSGNCSIFDAQPCFLGLRVLFTFFSQWFKLLFFQIFAVISFEPFYRPQPIDQLLNGDRCFSYAGTYVHFLTLFFGALISDSRISKLLLRLYDRVFGICFSMENLIAFIVIR